MSIRKLLSAILLFLSFFTNAQNDTKTILLKAYDKCQQVRNGYYEMTQYRKYFSSKDTSEVGSSCYFKKVGGDTLSSCLFNWKYFYRDTFTQQVIYNGKELLQMTPRDSTATIFEKEKWAPDIKNRMHEYNMYTPFTNKDSHPMPDSSDFANKKETITQLSDENILGQPCYHFQLVLKPAAEKGQGIKIIRYEYHYWVRKDNSIPAQYSSGLTAVINKDTMFQYERYLLTKYHFNDVNGDERYTTNSIPTFYQVKNYTPFKMKELLPNDTIPPAWTLTSLKNEKMSLTDMKGKLVVLDFFYKSCYPCMLSIPGLQSLYEKYNTKGLTVIGIDSYDANEPGLKAFLDKRGVTYPVLQGNKELEQQYNVNGHPTLYVIGKDGKILFSQIGYSKKAEEELGELIKKNL